MPVLMGSLIAPTISTAVPGTAPSGSLWPLWRWKAIALVPLGSRYAEPGSSAASRPRVAHTTIAVNMTTNALALNKFHLLLGTNSPLQSLVLVCVVRPAVHADYSVITRISH